MANRRRWKTVKYIDSKNGLDTPKKILKVNHAGEFGAINIYKAQILICKFLNKEYVEMLEGFMKDEENHLQIFWEEIQRRNGAKCKSYWLCGLGGYTMGIISALLGKKGIMACTWAVESVVVEHLENQLEYLKSKNDEHAYFAVRAILDDEEHHRDTGLNGGGMNPLYKPLRFLISTFTEGVIRLGMR